MRMALTCGWKGGFVRRDACITDYWCKSQAVSSSKLIQKLLSPTWTCFCPLPQPVFVFLAVHTSTSSQPATLCHPSNYSTLLYSSYILDACIRTAAVLKNTNASAWTQNLLPAEFCTRSWSKAGPFVIERPALVLAFKFLRVLYYSITWKFKLSFRNSVVSAIDFFYNFIFYIYIYISAFN